MQYIIFTLDNLPALYWIVFHLDMRSSYNLGIA